MVTTTYTTVQPPTDWLSIWVTLAVLLFIGLIIYTKIQQQSLKDTIVEIAEAIKEVKNE